MSWLQTATLGLAAFSVLGGTCLLVLSFSPPGRAADPSAVSRLLRSGSVLSFFTAITFASLWYAERSHLAQERLGAALGLALAHLAVGAMLVRWFFRSNGDLLARFQPRGR